MEPLARSARLDAKVVPWHTFNFIGIGPVDLEACHPKYQSSRGQAEALGFPRCGFDLLSQTITFVWTCHKLFSPQGAR
jgi:hypothetical protein